MNKDYELIVIGGGISACTFISNIQKSGFLGNIAIVEAGRGLGGRMSTRFNKFNKNCIINHGCPSFNIENKSNNLLLKDFINQLKINKLIKKDDSLIIHLNKNFDQIYDVKNDFYKDNLYIPYSYMSKFMSKVLHLNNSYDQIDYFFQSFINNLNFNGKKWIVTSNNGLKLSSKFLICTSNLLLHERSKKILKVDEAPLREALLHSKSRETKEIIQLSYKQEYIKRINFLIYLKPEYNLKYSIKNKNIHFVFNKELEKLIGFERIIFQRQYGSNYGIVIHTKDLEDLIIDIDIRNKDLINKNIVDRFNMVFKNNIYITKINDYEDISIMFWRSSQPKGNGIPPNLQILKDYNIGFCGDWFDFEGFGKVEGAIISGLELSKKIINFL